MDSNLSRQNRPLRLTEKWILSSLGFLGFVLFALLFPISDPTSHVNVQVDAREAIEIASQHMSRSVADISSFSDRITSFRTLNRQVSFYQAVESSEQAREQMEPHASSSYWQVLFSNPETRDTYTFRVSVQGEVFQCEREPPEDLSGANISMAEAEAIVSNFFSSEMGISLADYTRINGESLNRNARIDHRFTYAKEAPLSNGATPVLRATVMGDVVSSWSRSFTFPQSFEVQYGEREQAVRLRQILSLLLVVALWTSAILVFALRFRASEVSIRNGIILSGIIAICFLFYVFDVLQFLISFTPFENQAPSLAIQLINLGIQGFFTILGFFLVWMSGESHTRDIWPNKLRAVDELLARFFVTPSIGRGILRGFALGFITLGIWYGSYVLIQDMPGNWDYVSTNDQESLSALSVRYPFIPPLGAFAYAGFTALLGGAYMFLFSFVLLKKTTSNTWVAAGITILFFGSVFPDTILTLPVINSILIGFITLVIAFYFFVRFDLLTIVVSIFITTLAPQLAEYTLQTQSSFWISGLWGWIIMGGIFLFGLFASLKGREPTEEAIQPMYARYISERQRLKLELDVARRAHLQMLPRSVPVTQGLDIAAFCEPAREVGGDYYDFFQISDHKLGFAIGDVSGKGISAALYMTMLKGSLKSQAGATPSPAVLLSKVNETFYETADRTTFVTLLYGIIDLEASTLTFARAGHNPALIYRPSTHFIYSLQPPGLGIGLESGTIFSRVTREESFNLQAHDIIIVYTDGLTEGRNNKDEEWGPERLSAIIQEFNQGSAEDMMNLIRDRYNAFTGNTDPLDDLTCMVIRII